MKSTKKLKAGTCDRVSKLERPDTNVIGIVQKNIRKNINTFARYQRILSYLKNAAGYSQGVFES